MTTGAAARWKKLGLSVLRASPGCAEAWSPASRCSTSLPPVLSLEENPLQGSITGTNVMPRFPPMPQGESGEQGENGSRPSQKGPISQQTALVPRPSKVAQKIKGLQLGLEGPGEVVYIYLTRKLIDKQTT